MADIIESSPTTITNMAMGQAPESAPVTEASEGGEGGELTAIEALANQAEQTPAEAESAKIEAEVKAEAEKREAEEKAQAEEARKAKFERAKLIADREAKKVAERKQLQQMARKAEYDRQQLANQLAAERARIQEYEKFYADFRSDPAAHMERLGVTAESIARKALEESTPENKLTRLEADLKARQDRLEQQIAEQQRKEAQLARQAQIDRGRQDFIHHAKNADRYPALAQIAEIDARSLVREAESALNEAVAQFGPNVDITDDDLREALENKYSRILNLRSSKDTADKSQPSTARTPEKISGPGTPAKTVAGTPQTLTSRANVRAVAPPSLDEMDDVTARKALAELYRSKRKSG